MTRLRGVLSRFIGLYAIVTVLLLVDPTISSIFNLAVLPTFATRWLIPRLPDFQSRHPEVTITLYDPEDLLGIVSADVKVPFEIRDVIARRFDAKPPTGPISPVQ